MSLIGIKIKNIDKKRDGINKKIFNQIKDPFYKLPFSLMEERSKVKTATTQKQNITMKKSTINTQKESSPLHLQLIINKSALINKQWYHVGDDIEGYKIIAIKNDYVIVDQYGEKSKLKTTSPNSKIRLKTKKRVK